MNYKLIGDSSSDLTSEMQEALSAEMVPLTLLLGDETFVDDDNLNVGEFVSKMKAFRGIAKSGCPSPGAFLEKCIEGGMTFIVTLSSQLSGSFASASVAKKLAQDRGDDAYVFDSKSASAAQLLICIRISEFINQGLEKSEIIRKTEELIGSMRTLFVLENLDNLVKNGRMSRITGLIAGALHIRPILGADENGNIALYSKAKGSRRAMERLAEMIGETCRDTADRILTITHCNNPEHANLIRKIALERYSFKQIVVAPTRGLSSLYANEGGVIIAF